jgi:recombinational DNA repair ATPase RecF
MEEIVEKHSVEPPPDMVVFYERGMSRTNFIEAVYFFSSTASPRLAI